MYRRAGRIGAQDIVKLKPLFIINRYSDQMNMVSYGWYVPYSPLTVAFWSYIKREQQQQQ